MLHTGGIWLRTIAVVGFIFVAPGMALGAPSGGHEGAHSNGTHEDVGHAHEGEASHASGGGHGADASHGDAHGESHDGGHHACYSCDDDHDGTANWMDPDSGDEQYALQNVGLHAINLLLLIGVLWWAGVGAVISDGLRGRAILISKDIRDASKTKQAAVERHAAISDRLATLEGEIDQIAVNAERDAKAEEARIDERAVEAAKRLAETSIRQIQDETSRAKQVLRKEAVELAVELAQSILEKQVQAGDQRRLAQEFLTAVRSEEVTHG
jgi:F-type H+-transporting ATPase subunit b